MQVLAPAVAAALHELEVLDPRHRPMLAAHWVVRGLGGHAVAELAGLRGDEQEVSDLWPEALRELGVPSPLVRARRTALPWLAARVTSGEQDLPWLLLQLWPTRTETSDGDELLDQIVYGIDTSMDYIGAVEEQTDGRPRSRTDRRKQELVDRLRINVTSAVEALLEGGLDAAAAALER